MKYNEHDFVMLKDGRVGQLTEMINNDFFVFTFQTNDGDWSDETIESWEISHKVDRSKLYE